MRKLVTSKGFHLSQLVVGDRFRYVDGRFVFKIIEAGSGWVKIKNRNAEKIWTISTDKIVIKFSNPVSREQINEE